MTDKSSIVVLGVPDLDKDEIDLFNEIGNAIYQSNRQLVTTKSKGVGAAVHDGFRKAGGTTEWLPHGEIPDHDRVLVFGDQHFQKRLDEAVPDWRDRGWDFYQRHQFAEFWALLVGYIALRSRPKSGDG